MSYAETRSHCPWAGGVLCAAFLIVVTACSSSASLAREGNFPEACLEAVDESRDEQGVLRELLFAKVSPKLSLEMVEPEKSSELRALVGNRHKNLRFARVAIELEKVDFEARMYLASIDDTQAHYQVGYVNEYVAADLVYSEPEGDLARLALFGKFILQGALNFTLVTLCAVGRAQPDCMGLWTEDEREAMRRLMEKVNADPELRRRQQQLLVTAKEGKPLVVLSPNPSSRLSTSVVRLHMLLHTRFSASGNGCTYQQEIVVELPGQDVDEVIEREFSRRARSLRSLRPTLE